MTDEPKPVEEAPKAQETLPVAYTSENFPWLAGPNNPIWLKTVMRHRADFSEEVQMKALQAVMQVGTVGAAAVAAGMSHVTLRKHLKKDPVFAERFEQAKAYFNARLESAVIKRAIEGWQEPIYSNKTGALLGHKTVYDGKLAEVLLKRHEPEYRNQTNVDVNVKGGVLLLSDSPKTFDEWNNPEENNLQKALENTIVIEGSCTTVEE